MSRFRDLMIAAAAAEPCLTFDIIAEAGQTVNVRADRAATGEAWSVDWGDGSSDSVNQSGPVALTHTYSTGFYHIKFRAGTGGASLLILSGSTANICACNEAWHYHPRLLKLQFNTCPNSTLTLQSLPPSLTDMAYGFQGSPLIKVNCPVLPTGLVHFVAAFVGSESSLLPFRGLPSGLSGSLAEAFNRCRSAISIIDSLPEGITDMRAAFASCEKMAISFNKLPDGVTSLASCFYYCAGLTCDLDELAANAPEGGYTALTNLSSTFYNCPGVTGSRSAFLAACPNVTNTANAFNGTNTTE